MLTLQLVAAAALLVLGTGIPGIPGIPGIAAVPAPGRGPAERPAPARLPPRRKRSPSAPSSLRWVPFQGRVPPDAVSSWNRRTDRPEFVCSTRARGCNVGAFDPERGPFCFFPWSEGEERSSSFQLLLNPGGFEALDWVDASFGSTPEGAVEGCPLTDIFVGRSRDGLGKVSKEQQALFVAVEGEEIWYKWYQVLVVRPGATDISISNVSYSGEAARERSEAALLAEVPARNDGCGAALRALTLEEATETEHDWSAELPALAAARGVLRAAPPLLTETGWELGNETAVPWAGGASASEFVWRAHEVREEIPARSECAVVLRGLRRELRVPFSASLTRQFRSGRRHRLAIAGWARSRAVTGVRAGLERCRPLSDLPPCPD